MNKTVVFLRIAAVLTFIHAILHTIGGVFGPTEPGAATIAVQAMKANEFLLMGHVRSYWAFYRGIGLRINHLPHSRIDHLLATGLFGKDGRGANTADADHVRDCLLRFCRGFVHVLFYRTGNR